MAMDALYKKVQARVEGSKVEERSKNKLWLVHDLEIARQFILDDLRVVKQCCVPCFPPDFNVFAEYVKMYHLALSKHVNSIRNVFNFEWIIHEHFLCVFFVIVGGDHSRWSGG